MRVLAGKQEAQLHGPASLAPVARGGRALPPLHRCSPVGCARRPAFDAGNLSCKLRSAMCMVPPPTAAIMVRSSSAWHAPANSPTCFCNPPRSCLCSHLWNPACLPASPSPLACLPLCIILMKAYQRRTPMQFPFAHISPSLKLICELPISKRRVCVLFDSLGKRLGI